MFLRATVLLATLAAPLLAQEAATTRPVLNRLGLERFAMKVEADEETAKVVVEEVFYNSGSGIREADFLFPLPSASAASGLQLSMGGKYYGGNLLSRSRARRIYSEITRRSRDPALLDCVGKDLYRCRVFPVPARGKASVRFAYTQPLSAEGSLRRLELPLDAARFNRSPAREFSLEIELATGGALQAVLCPTHDVEVIRDSAHTATVRLEARDAYLARDLVLLYAVEDAPLGAAVASYRGKAQSAGYFVLSVDAAFARERQKDAPRDVVVAVDTSNSAGRNGIDSAAAALAEALAELRPGKDRYALMSFSTEPRLLADFQHPDKGMDGDIRDLFARHPVAGRTQLGAAIRGATELAAQGRPGTGMILLTDGIETESGHEALDLAGSAVEAGHRVGLCGVGPSVDAVRLDELGTRGEGDSAYATRGGGLTGGVRHLLATTRTAPLTDVHVTLEGGERLYPPRLRMIQPGESILVAGRYKRDGDVNIHVSARVAGERVERTVRVRLKRRGGDPAVARMWASRRVGHLLDQARVSGKPNLHKAEIQKLGRRFGIVTPHSSLLVLEEADQNRYLNGLARRPLMTIGDGAGVMGRRAVVTRERAPAAELADRIRRLQRCRSGVADPFADLLGANRLKVRQAAGRTFYRMSDGTWVEAELTDEQAPAGREVAFLSAEWEALSEADDAVAQILALGSHVLFRDAEGAIVRVVDREAG